MKIFTLLISLLFFCMPAWAQDIAARLDRSEINQNETVQLTITVAEVNSQQEPDLKKLLPNFEIVGTVKSSQLSFVNGKGSQQTEWQITLAPRQAGEITIPALAVGSLQTSPLKLRVAKGNLASAANSKLFLEVEANPKDPYVQSQIIYAVRLYVAENMQGGTLADPVIPNAIIMRLGNDTNFQAMRHGRNYQVVQRRYAIFPQSSGELTIPAPIFTGQLLKANNLDPFFSQGQPVRLAADKIVLQVKAKAISNGDWLPAQDITLTETWPPNNLQWRVGEPVTRTITLNAVGLSGEQLPDLTKLSAEGFNIYPGAPKLVTTANDKAVLGQREVKLTYIPTQDGTQTIPAVQIKWWNTQQHRQQTATLPAQTVQVAAALPQHPTAATTSAAPVPNTKALNAAPAPSMKTTYWPWVIAGIAVFAWLSTLIAWWCQKHNPVLRASLPRQDPLAEIKQAALANQPQHTKNALLQWAASVWPTKPVRNLGDVLTLIDSAALKAAIQALDSHLYAAQTIAWDGQKFWEIFSQAVETQQKTKVAKPQVLPPLYPE